MTRKKVELAYITNDSARKATYKKRKAGLLKKVSELSTLCDIPACAIIYSPYEPRPDTWPATPAGVHGVLSRFHRVPHMEQCKRMVDQERFLAQRIRKAAEQLRRHEKENRDKEVALAVSECLAGKMDLGNLSLTDLDIVSGHVEQQLADVDRRIADLSRGGGGGGGLSDMGSGIVGPAAGVVEPKEEYGESAVERMQREQWFMELMNPAPVPTIQVTAEEQLQVGFFGDELMPVVAPVMAAAAAGSSSGGGYFGESSNGGGGGYFGESTNVGGGNNGNAFWGSD